MERTQPWDRRDKESTPAFAAFQMYRDLGSERSHSEVSRQSGKHVTLMARWSKRFDWVDRVAAWDLHLDREKQQQAEIAVREMGDRHAQIAVAGLNIVIRRLLGTDSIEGAEGNVAALDPNTLSAADLARFAVSFAQLEREARGYIPLSEAIDMEFMEDTTIDMSDPAEQDKVIELAEWIGRRVG